jgi:murein DD-endopeptidase MepM/ murein hydrolase activator NlpD
LNIKEHIARLMTWFSTVVIVNVRDEDNYELKQTLRLSHLKVVLYLFLSLCFVFIISFMLIKTVLSSWFDPVHIRVASDRKMIALSYKIDSLEQEINGRDVYLSTLKQVINGGVATTDKMVVEQKQESDSEGKSQPINLDQLTAEEIDIRKEFEDDDQENQFQNNFTYGLLSKLNYFVPLNGLIIAKFDPATRHYGVDIVAKAGASIHAIADGKVLFSDWTKDAGNVLIIQHKGSLLSIYKHNSALLKKVGSFVKAGEAIAIIGNAGELTSGPHLHLELWFAGHAINPQRFIPFD